MMKRILVIALLICGCFSVKAQYVADELGKSFVKKTISMPNDYEGKVVCTLVKHLGNDESPKAVLYVHGYNDYFYQVEMATRFSNAGYRFYAIDLRKYGRSLLPNQIATNAHDMSEYFADIDSAYSTIRKEGVKHVILMGHSMGGLITSIYAESKGKNLGFDAMILNAPFFDFNENWFNEHIAVPSVSALARVFPDLIIKAGKSTAYGESLHKKYHGNWEYDLKKKLLASGDKHWCWIRAIHLAQLKVQSGLQIHCPILTLSSDKSTYGESWNPSFQTADAVLDVNDIQIYAKKLGLNSKTLIFPGGMHDLVLSKQNVRNAVYQEIFRWLRLQKL